MNAEEKKNQKNGIQSRAITTYPVPFTEAYSERQTPWQSLCTSMSISDTDETSTPNQCRMMLKVVQPSNKKVRFRIYFCGKIATRLGTIF